MNSKGIRRGFRVGVLFFGLLFLWGNLFIFDATAGESNVVIYEPPIESQGSEVIVFALASEYQPMLEDNGE
ncbi:MAG: hypothetical protein HY586_06455 [Candidatus Omnitrophica bacterium]|nr:hypothetical protein [Candidatus Omnitrophota bacterium]